MEKHIVYSYDKDLEKLRSSVVLAANLVLELLSIASDSINNFHNSYVELSESKDNLINELDEKIEYLSISLLALRQPMAVDLRNIVSSLRLAVIIERMGDLTKKVSHRTEFLNISLSAELKDNFSRAKAAFLADYKGLTVEQLSKAKTLYMARFDDEILDQIKTSLPELVGT